jgi:microsomal dipeptidase-like Zn-dependent dipeptidase
MQQGLMMTKSTRCLGPFVGALLLASACSSSGGDTERELPAGSASSSVVAPVPGFADLHVHMMAEEAFGGRWLHGRYNEALSSCDGGVPPSDHGRLKQDLHEILASSSQCAWPPELSAESMAELAAQHPFAYGLLTLAGGPIASEAISKIPGTQGDTGLHLGRQAFGSWPSWDTIAHQQAHQAWLQQAHQRGLSLVVMSAVSYDWLCKLLPEANGRGACDEMEDVKLQLRMAQQFDQANDWVEIALSPSHARQIIHSGRLAMVLSVEASRLFNNDAGSWRAQLDELHALGVRTLQAVHETDNLFAGAALHNAVFQVASYTENCIVDYGCDGATLGFHVRKEDGVCENVKGLTSYGRELFGAMIDKKMLIDVAHLSSQAIRDTLELVKGADYYPLYLSHGHPREIMHEHVASKEKSTPAWVMQGIRQTGGMLGLRTFPEATHGYDASGVANTCHGSSRSFAQAYAYAAKGLKVPVAFGSDFNGFIQQTRPRFGPDGCSATEWAAGGARLSSFEAAADCQRRDEREHGPAGVGSDFDTKGLAHIGLLPDLVQELQTLGADVAPLLSSAETFVRMWERAEGPRGGWATPADDVDTSGITHLPSDDDLQDSYPLHCNKHYCANHAELGMQCRFNGECRSEACSASDLTCGVEGGVCVCNADSDCGAGSFCNKGPDGNVIGGNNGCEAKRADHSFCTRGDQCQSGACGSCGICYTPSSRAVGDSCRINAECGSGACSSTDAGCGLASGHCVCDDDPDCGSGHWCKLGVPLVGADNTCVQKKAKGNSCFADRECQSNRCSWLRCR